MARGGKGRSGRRYVRDAKGRFASKGAGATARGGRLKTASGKKRATQTMKVSGAKAAGTISKPKGLKPNAIKSKPQVSSARQAATNRIKIKTETRRKLKTDRESVIPSTPKGPKTIKANRVGSTVSKPRTKGNLPAQVASRVKRKNAANEAGLRQMTRYGNLPSPRAYNRAIKKANTLKRADAYLKTGKLPGRDNSIKAQRERKAASQRLAAKNAERKAAQQAASARPARVAARTALKRTGRKVSIPSLKTNTEKGRKGIVSMSTGAKQARRGAVAERKAERRARVAERQSGIVARRQNNRLSTYLPSGAFNQAAQNLNQSKLKKSKQIQSWLTTRNPADKPQSRRRKRK